MEVASEGLDRGASFTIRLPILAVRVEPSDVNHLREKPEMPQLNGTTVLVVDDDVEAGRLVVRVLMELGADARAVSSVTEALRALRSFRADVVVSDIAMPGEDGYALMKRLRELQPQMGRSIHTMALTGYGRPEDRHRILASGFQKYIQKPVEPFELARAIAGLVHD